MSSRQNLSREALGQRILAEFAAMPVARPLSDAQAEAVYAQAYHQFAQNNFEDALGFFRVLVAFRPADKTFLLGAALCLQKLGQWDAAIAGYTFLGLIDPHEPAHQLARAECQLLARKRDDAEKTLQLVLEECGALEAHAKVRARAQAMLELLRNHHERIAA